jgi:hypothetical protein
MPACVFVPVLSANFVVEEQQSKLETAVERRHLVASGESHFADRATNTSTTLQPGQG